MIWCWCLKTAKRALNVKLPSRNLSLTFLTKMVCFVWICWKNLFWDCTKVCPPWKRTHRNKIECVFWEDIDYCRIHIFLIWQHLRQLYADLKTDFFFLSKHLLRYCMTIMCCNAQWYMRVRKAKLKVFKKLLSNVFSTWIGSF